MTHSEAKKKMKKKPLMKKSKQLVVLTLSNITCIAVYFIKHIQWILNRHLQSSPRLVHNTIFLFGLFYVMTVRIRSEYLFPFWLLAVLGCCSSSCLCFSFKTLSHMCVVVLFKFDSVVILPVTCYSKKNKKKSNI